MAQPTHTDNDDETETIRTHSIINRRRYLIGTSAVLAASLAGCTGSDDNGADNGDDDEGDPAEGSDEGEDGNGEENDQEEEEELTEEDVEQREVGTDVLEFEDLEIIEYEEEIEEAASDFADDNLVISGVVENHSDEPYDSITVGVRAFDEDGHQIDRYIDITSDVQGGGTWAFEINIYDVPADDVAEWDIGVSGYQW